MIDWKTRIKNKTFWATLIPAVLILASQTLSIFGIEIDFGGLSDELLAAVGTVFAVLAILGIVADPTTEGLADAVEPYDGRK